MPSKYYFSTNGIVYYINKSDQFFTYDTEENAWTLTGSLKRNETSDTQLVYESEHPIKFKLVFNNDDKNKGYISVGTGKKEENDYILNVEDKELLKILPNIQSIVSSKIEDLMNNEYTLEALKEAVNKQFEVENLGEWELLEPEENSKEPLKEPSSQPGDVGREEEKEEFDLQTSRYYINPLRDREDTRKNISNRETTLKKVIQFIDSQLSRMKPNEKKYVQLNKAKDSSNEDLEDYFSDKTTAEVVRDSKLIPALEIVRPTLGVFSWGGNTAYNEFKKEFNDLVENIAKLEDSPKPKK